MLYYRDIVFSALTKEVEPALREISKIVLINTYGNDWLEQRVIPIMQNYPDYKNEQEHIENGNLDALDITALLYLISPPTKDENNNSDKEKGILSDLSKYFNWNSEQKNKVKRIRKIRNNIVHNKLDVGVSGDEESLLKGVQEYKWFNEIEEILTIIDPKRSIQEYKSELDKEVKNNIKLGSEFSPAKYRVIQLEKERLDYEKYYRKEEFMKTKLNLPIVGIAPFASNETLISLPWPSLMEKEQQIENNNNWKFINNQQDTQNKPKSFLDSIPKGTDLSNNIQNLKDIDVSQAIDKTVDKAAHALNKGANKLFKWLEKRK